MSGATLLGSTVWRRHRLLAIANPIAGGGRNRTHAGVFESAVRRMGLEVELAWTSGPGDAVRLAGRAPVEGFDGVIAIGGDGTLAEVAVGLAAATEAWRSWRQEVAVEIEGSGSPIPEGAIPIGVCPTGTANVVARALGLRPFDIKKAASIACAGPVAWIDALNVRSSGEDATPRERWALFAASVGFDAEVVHALHAARSGGISYGSYVGPVLRAIASYRPNPLTVQVDGGELLSTPLTIIASTREYAGPWIRFRAGPALDDGRAEAYLIDARSRFSLMRGALRGVFRGIPGGIARRVQGSDFRIVGPRPTPVQADGDPAGFTPLEVRVAPRYFPMLYQP